MMKMEKIWEKGKFSGWSEGVTDNECDDR